MIHDKLEPNIELARYWVRKGAGKSIFPTPLAARKLNVIQYFSIDTGGFILLVILLVLYAIVKAMLFSLTFFGFRK